MCVVNGKREWLVAWADGDANGVAYPDTWEGTAFVTPDLIDSFLKDGVEKRRREITEQVDVPPNKKRTAARARQRAWLSLVVEGKAVSQFPVSVQQSSFRLLLV